MKRVMAVYLVVSALLLSSTATAKAIAWSHGGQLWNSPHGYFKSITYGNLAEIGLLVEVIALAGIVIAKRVERKVAFATGAGVAFGLFKTLLLVLGVKEACYCLGGFELPPHTERMVSNAIVAWLLLGGLLPLFVRREPAAAGGTSELSS